MTAAFIKGYYGKAKFNKFKWKTPARSLTETRDTENEKYYFHLF